MSSCQNINLTKCQVEKMTSGQNDLAPRDACFYFVEYPYNEKRIWVIDGGKQLDILKLGAH